jgi:nicotinamidase-related amidase
MSSPAPESGDDSGSGTLSAMEALAPFNIPRTALLAMDCQAGIISVYVKPAGEFLARAASALQAARRSGMQVIHVQVGFRPGLPEVSRRNKIFAAVLDSPQHQQFFQGASGAIHPALSPELGDIVVTKHRISAFAGTDLSMILRAKEIETLVLFGIATSGVVLSTLLDAGDADYRIVVISDCCADQDAELHGSLLNRLFPRRADVINADDFVKALQSAT